MGLDVTACFDAHRARVYRWALGLCGSDADAADITQEVFLRMLRRPPAVEAPGALVAWLRRVTATVAVDRWRRARVRRLVEEQAVAARPVAAPPADAEEAQRVRAALAELSPQQRLVVLGKSYDGLTFREIAAELGISVPTAKTHYVRALAAIRGKLAGEAGEVQA
jgi:RNA polymerase sigma factor (sigma-70 family)